MRGNLKGQGIGRGHIDGVLLPGPIGTDFGWYTDDIPIQAQGDLITTYYAGVWHVEAPHGANWLRAGKGRWFAFYHGTTDDMAPADVDPYFGTAIFTRYSTGSDIILLELDGHKTTITTGPLGTDAVGFRNARQRGGWLLYQENGIWRLLKAPSGGYVSITSRVEFVDYAVPVSFGGKVLLLERASGRLTLRYPDSTMGWLIHTDLASDGLVVPDALEFNGKIRVWWSNNQSESASVFATKDIDLNSEQVDLNDVPVNIAPYGRSIPQWAYYTYDAGRKYGNYPQEVLNIAWCSGDSPSDVEKANANDQYVITGLELIGQAKRKAFILCTNDYWNAPPLQDQVNAAIPLCVAYNIRMVVYDEKNEKPTLPEWAFQLIRCFREPDESLNEWVARAEKLIRESRTKEIALLLGVEDRLGQLAPEVIRETALAATELLRKYKQIRLAGWFSYARTAMDASGKHIPPGGAILYPDVWAVVKASYKASEPYAPKDFELPETPPIDPPKPPTTGLLRGRLIHG